MQRDTEYMTLISSSETLYVYMKPHMTSKHMDTRVGSETLNTRQGNNTFFANIIWKRSEQRVGSVLKYSSLFHHFLSSGKFRFLIVLQSFRSSLLVSLREFAVSGSEQFDQFNLHGMPYLAQKELYYAIEQDVSDEGIMCVCA